MMLCQHPCHPSSLVNRTHKAHDPIDSQICSRDAAAYTRGGICELDCSQFSQVRVASPLSLRVRLRSSAKSCPSPS